MRTIPSTKRTAGALALAAVIGFNLVAGCTRPDAVTTVATPSPTSPPTVVTTPAPTTTVAAPEVDQAATVAFLEAWRHAEWESAARYAVETARVRQIATPQPRSAVPAVAGTPKPAQSHTAPLTGGNPGSFLSCVRNRESRGNYTAVNPSGAAGAYQFMPGTARAVASHAGRPDLAGRPVTSWSPADQDAMAQHLYSWQGAAPWAGPGC